MNVRAVGAKGLLLLIGLLHPVVIAHAQFQGSTNFGVALDVTAQGTDIGGTSDQGSFNYQPRTGDFDVQVRVQSLAPSDAWAKAGLMARGSLATNSVFASALASPSLAGCFFESRSATGGNTTATGSFPVNYPDTWLRLKRAGNAFSGFASLDGATWAPLGSATLTMSNTILVGVAATSHNPAQPTTAQFRDWGNAGSGQIVNAMALPERLGPSSRKTGLVISEILYKPAARTDGKNLEFIELFNSNPFFEDISGYHIDGDIQFTFPAGTVMPGGSFLAVAKSPTDLQSVWGITNVAGPYAGSLKSSGLVQLVSRRGAIYLEVPYSNKPPWPVGADGTGHSLVLARPSYGEAEPRAWAASEALGGSPGVMETVRPDPLRAVVINEFLAHWHQGVAGFIELYNHSNQSVDLSGCWLSDDPTTNKFQIPAGTSIAPRGFVAFTKSALNFGLSAKGLTLYLLDPTATRILDAERFEPQTENVSLGRFPDGAAAFYPLTEPSPGASNGPILIRDVAINEIMYAPISGDPDDEYVELYNQGASAVALGGWQFAAGISFAFPTNAVIPAHGYLVVARNATNLMAHYPNLNRANTVGDFQGTLSGKGERLALAMPESIVTTDKNNELVTNLVNVVVDEVSYGVGGRWGQWAHGGGSSLELVDPRANHRLAGNWADSDETRKSAWVTIQNTGRLDNGSGTADSLQIIMLGGGECLVDDVAVTNSLGSNVVANGSFEGGLTNWFSQGTEIRSSLETNTGVNGSQCLHVRASEEADTGANRIRTHLTQAPAGGTTATIRAQVRWLHGWPEILFRLKGNYLEATGNTLTTQSFGTPGLPNSRAAPNAGPVIYEVTHSPAVPPAGQPVVVTARVDDPDGIQSLVLKYRLDPSTTYATVKMVDDGTGGDAVAGDGIYSATLPAQVAGAMVAFYLAASDNFVPSATTLFPDNAPMRECLVRFGDPVPTSGFGTYRLWLTQKTVTTWAQREVLSHEPLDGTFVYGTARVVYNMSARYTGSPYHQGYNSPIGSPCQYTFTMPDDDQVLGTTSFNKQHAPGNTPNDDPTIQTEQTAYWMARQLGLPWNYKRYVVMFVNGVRRGPLMEDTQVPDGEIIKEDFPNDTEGDLHKLYGWFEFNDDGRTFQNVAWATLQPFTTTGGVKKLARYRWNWRPRALHGSANNFTNLFALVDAANPPVPNLFVPRLENSVDMDNWMRTFALNHAVGNWDSYGNSNGQNMYAYKPPHGNWTVFLWDFNIVLGNSGSNGPTGDDIFQVGDPTIGRIYNVPVFRRNYLRVIKEIIDGPMVATNVNPVMDAKFSAFQAEGLGVTSPRGVESWIATRRKYLLSKLSTVSTNFVITSNSGADFASATNWITLSGLAPVDVDTIKVNGIAYPVSWVNVSAWQLTLPLVAQGTNALVLQGYGPTGLALTNAIAAIHVTFTGNADRPENHVVINEIMYHPAAPDAEFVELLNTSTTTTFDLSQWRLAGVEFTFPDATALPPLGFLVVAKSRSAFAAAYGATTPVVGEFNGRLNRAGQNLALIKPGAGGAADTVISQVTYSSAPPWPEAADGTGASLQLIAPTQDITRVANWTAVPTNRTDGRWQFVSVTGTASSSRLYLYLTSPGDVYVDDLSLVAGNRPGGGPNLLANGGFESALTGPWTVSPNLAESAISTNVKHSGLASLHVVATNAGTTRDSSIWEDAVPALVTNAPYTLSYWYLPSTNGADLTLRLSGSGIVSTRPIAPATLPALASATPGAPNSVRTDLPPFPLLWLNEVQPTNANGVTDAAGAHSPWLELFNAGTNAIDLGDWYLADNNANTIQWAFPPGARIDPGQFLIVWADGQSDSSATNELHTGFRLAPASGTVVLSQLQSNQPVILDYLSYNLLNPGRAYGAFPDGQAVHRQVFAVPTPGAPNDNRFPPVTVSINEWMAGNTQTALDPLTGNYDDWFELYNAETNAVDLTDYTLTDDWADPARFVVPPGAVIPPNGFLLVWADNAVDANTPPGDLHVNFKLAKAGSFLSLLAPDGATVDTVAFGPQMSDVSEGRSPDGAPPPFQFMTTPTPGAPNLAPAPRLIGATVGPNGDAVFAWAAHAGKPYRVQSTDDLSAGNWLDLATNLVVNSATGSFRDPRGTQRGRFYRVIQE